MENQNKIKELLESRVKKAHKNMVDKVFNEPSTEVCHTLHSFLGVKDIDLLFKSVKIRRSIDKKT